LCRATKELHNHSQPSNILVGAANFCIVSDNFFVFLTTVLREVLAMDCLMGTELLNENNSKINAEDSKQYDQVTFKRTSKHRKLCYEHKILWDL